MKRNAFIVVVLFYVFSIITSSGDQINFMADQLYIQQLADDLANNSPIDIVIALDSSASMINQSNESREIALTFLKLIENKKNDNIRVGYVSWNHNATISEPPLRDYKIIQSLINRSSFGGNTCFGVGVNRSMELLSDNNSESIKKAIVFISDGRENCNKTGNEFECSDLERIKDSGISLYVIPTIGNKTELIQCLENFSEYLPNEKSAGKNITELSDEPADPFVLQARGREIQIKELETDVTVTKTVKGGTSGPLIVLKITAPPVEDIKNAIVLALDSSGSFGLGGRPDHGVVVRKAVSNVLNKTAKTYPKINISILSWDDNIDFAYSNLTNNEPAYAKMVPIAQADEDFRINHVFIPAEEYQFLNWWRDENYNDISYSCKENESTNLNVGIRGAIDTLDANYPRGQDKKEETISKSIILITGRSEFTDYIPEIINEAKEKEYKIYPVGLGVIDNSRLKDSLKYIAYVTGGTYKYSPNSLDFTEEAVITDIFGAIEETLMDTVADNITIIESLYPYLTVTDIYAKSNGITINNPFNNNPLRPIDQNTWEIKLRDGLKAGEYIEIYLETEVDMQLPVDVTENITKMDFTPNAGTIPSAIIFDWRGIKEFKVPLPENSMSI